jgi:hypothetical protein
LSRCFGLAASSAQAAISRPRLSAPGFRLEEILIRVVAPALPPFIVVLSHRVSAEKHWDGPIE